MYNAELTFSLFPSHRGRNQIFVTGNIRKIIVQWMLVVVFLDGDMGEKYTGLTDIKCYW